MPDFTVVSISGIEIPTYASRGIGVTVRPDQNGELVRDVEGTLHDLTLTQFQKRRVTLSFSDQEAPILRGIFRGAGPYDVTLMSSLGLANTDGTTTISMMVDDWEAAVADEWEVETQSSIDLIEV